MAPAGPRPSRSWHLTTSARPNGASPFAPTTQQGAQVPVPGTANDYSQRVRCTRCAVDYPALIGYRSTCPVCDADQRICALQKALQVETQRAELLALQLSRQRSALETSEAMRKAVTLLDSHDMTFLKTVLYMWRTDKALQLRVQHGPMRGAGRKSHTKGFLLIPRTAEPEMHECTSVGGIAIAEEMDEEARRTSNLHAMNLLLRAMASHLAINDAMAATDTTDGRPDPQRPAGHPVSSQRRTP